MKSKERLYGKATVTRPIESRSRIGFNNADTTFRPGKGRMPGSLDRIREHQNDPTARPATF